jgi:hypothetical protein
VTVRHRESLSWVPAGRGESSEIDRGFVTSLTNTVDISRRDGMRDLAEPIPGHFSRTASWRRDRVVPTSEDAMSEKCRVTRK